MVDARLTNWHAAELITMGVGYSGLAVANSTAMSAYRRRADFAVLRASGGTDRQLLTTAVGETGVIVLVGSALGVMVTVPPLLAMAAGLSQVTENRGGSADAVVDGAVGGLGMLGFGDGRNRGGDPTRVEGPGGIALSAKGVVPPHFGGVSAVMFADVWASVSAVSLK